LGELYLRGGDGLVPQRWVDVSTRPHARIDNELEYGYLWWLRGNGGSRSFSMAGFGGNRVQVFPELELVAVIRGANFALRDAHAPALDVPVTAQLERAYGDFPGTARAAWEAGVAGMNFEDSTADGLVPIDEQVAAIRAIREAVPELVLNARVDIYLEKAGGVDEAVERANAYLAAGAHCPYPLFCPPGHLAHLSRRIAAPLR